MAVSSFFSHNTAFKASCFPSYRSGQINTCENDDLPLRVGSGKTLVHIMLGGGGTINMNANTEGTRSVVTTADLDPFAQQLNKLQLAPYQVVVQTVLPKPMDSSCHDAISLHHMALSIFTAYQAYLETLSPETPMVDPFKLLFPHGTDTLTHVTAILHYMILQAGLNMTVVPIGAIEPSNSPRPDGPANIQAGFEFLQTINVPGAFTVVTNPATKEGQIVLGTNAFKSATAGTGWLQNIGNTVDGLTSPERCRFSATQSALLTKGISPI